MLAKTTASSIAGERVCPEYLPMVTLKSLFRACTAPRRHASVVVWLTIVVLRIAKDIVSLLVVAAAVESSSKVTFDGAGVWVRFKSWSMVGTLLEAKEGREQQTPRILCWFTKCSWDRRLLTSENHEKKKFG